MAFVCFLKTFYIDLQAFLASEFDGHLDRKTKRLVESKCLISRNRIDFDSLAFVCFLKTKKKLVELLESFFECGEKLGLFRGNSRYDSISIV